MTAKPYHHGNLRAALLEAARAQLREHGSEAVSLRGLARELGVSTAAPYRHFADRRALLAGLAVQGLAELTAAIQGVPVGEPMTRVVVAYQDFARRDPSLYRLMLSIDTSTSPDVVEARRDLFAELLVRLEGEGAEPEEAIRHTAMSWSALHGAALFEADATLDWLDRWLRPDAGEVAKVIGAYIEAARGSADR